MNTYNFVLIFSLPIEAKDPEAYLDALYEAGCDDALVGTGQQGCIALEFERDAKSAKGAINSAIANVRSAIPGVELAEVKPDLVGLTDVAEIFNCSRQNIRKYLTNYPEFPRPSYTGTTSLWHLCDLAMFQKFDFPQSLADLSNTTFKINLEIQNQRHRKN